MIFVEQDIEKRLQTIEAKIDENHRLLVKMRRVQRNAGYVKIAYWALLIALSFGAWYFVKPYLSQLGEVYGFSIPDPHGITDQQNVDSLLKQLKQF